MLARLARSACLARSARLARFAYRLGLSLALVACSKARSDAARGTPAVSASASGSAAAAASVAPAAPAASAASRAATERAKQLLGDIQWMVARGVTVNPEKPGDGDAVSKCEAIEASRTNRAASADPEHAKTLEQATELCSFDVPLLTAKDALEQLRRSTRPSSRQLGCDVAVREIDKARKFRPDDTRVRDLNARRKAACKP